MIGSATFTYTFDESELSVLRELARQRNHPLKNSRKIDRLKSDETINVLGLMGEEAFSLFSKIPITQHDGPVGDGRLCDFRYKEFTIQVKYNSWPHGDFYINEHDHFKALVGVLVVPSGDDSVKLAGWTTHPFFLKHAVKKSYRLEYGGVTALAQDQLFAMDRLISYLDYMGTLRTNGFPINQLA
jgi:hypothetical protein